MFNGMMMDPELMRIAQEQMSRIPPQELAKIQQQMMSNPELMKLATESMKNLRPEDMKNAAEQLKHTRAEDMVEISEKMAKAKPEEIAAMHAHAEAQASHELNAAQMLKKQGNELHNCGKFHDASQKYLLAKNNLKGIPVSKCRTLQLQCSLNLMSCYLKMGKFEECIKEGSEVLAYDLENVKALYRRGQAYKELGKLESAVSDLSKAHEVAPEDETIADVLRDANEKLMKEGGHRTVSGSLVIEEIVEEDDRPMTSESHKSSSAEYSVSPPEAGEHSQSGGVSDNGMLAADAESLQALKDNPEAVRLFQNYVSNSNPDSLAASGAGGMSPEMVKTATDMIGKMKPDELQKMLQVTSSLNGKNPNFLRTTVGSKGNGSRLGSHFPEMTPEMVKMASDRISEMSPEELQKMVEVASSLNPSVSPFPRATSDGSTQRSISSQSSVTATSPATEKPGMGESSSGGVFSTSVMRSTLPTSTVDLQENMRNSMKNPAMRQMFSSMMKNMSPEMMANMSEQFGAKLSREEAAKAQQAMSSLSMDDLDRMMRWAERAHKGVETVKKTKNWLLGRSGLILAICMLILAFIFHRLGFIGG